jgi:predicted enzyme involved in methoxymalonyl-ACP biosynthesis
VEEALVHVAVVAAQSRGLTQLTALYEATAKNKPCRAFWLRSGFDQVGDNAFAWDLKQNYPAPQGIEIAIGTGVEHGVA